MGRLLSFVDMPAAPHREARASFLWVSGERAGLLLQLRRLVRLGLADGVLEELLLDRRRRSYHCRSTAAPRHCRIRSSPSERGMGWWRLGSSDAGPGAPPSLFHLARALAGGLLAFRLFGFLVIMHAIWHAEEPAATGIGAPCKQRQSDVAGA